MRQTGVCQLKIKVRWYTDIKQTPTQRRFIYNERLFFTQTIMFWTEHQYNVPLLLNEHGFLVPLAFRYIEELLRMSCNVALVTKWNI